MRRERRSDGFGFYEASFEIAVDDSVSFGSGVASVDGPGANFFFAGGEVAAKAEKMVGSTNDDEAGGVEAKWEKALPKLMEFLEDLRDVA